MTKNKILITGVAGFVGSHLAEYCLSQGAEVHGIKRWARSNLENLKEIKNQIHFHDCDMRDATGIRTIINEVKPDRIFHLAAQSYVPASWTSPSDTIETNVIGEINLFEAVRSVPDYNPKIQVACSSEEYGLVKEEETPIKEDNPLRPMSPYGVSKVAQDLLARQYFMSYGMDIVVTRGFNHTGPRRGENFICSTFAKQIAEIETGSEQIMYVGNLEARRDFTDVRDMVRAYWLALEKAKSGEVYNICSGKAYSMQDVLNQLSSLSKVKFEVKQDPKRMRPSDVPLLLGDNSKFVDATGWKPEIPFIKTLEDLLNFWRVRV